MTLVLVSHDRTILASADHIPGVLDGKVRLLPGRDQP
jgi:hypothetical protein